MAGISRKERERRAAHKDAYGARDPHRTPDPATWDPRDPSPTAVKSQLAQAMAESVGERLTFTRAERIAALAAVLPYCGIPATFEARLVEAERLAGLLLARAR